jgi:hypothetical protein
MLLLLIKVYGIFLHAEIIRIITDVDAEIDAALYRRYTTPFAERSQLIQKIETVTLHVGIIFSYLPNKKEQLLAPPLLRTVRETFASYRSSVL